MSSGSPLPPPPFLGEGVGGRGCITLVLGVGLLFAVCSVSGKQFGVRYVLPLYPAAVILGVLALHRLLASRPTLFLATLATVVGCQAVSAVGILPRPLSYFNGFCGGPDAGPDLLGNSDVDWGQGLGDVRDYLSARGETALVNKLFGANRAAEWGLIDSAVPADEGTGRRRPASEERRGKVSLGGGSWPV